MQGAPSMHGLLHIQEICSKLCLLVTLTVMTTPAAQAMLMHLAALDPLLASARQLTL